jgi:hypothetical protein
MARTAVILAAGTSSFLSAYQRRTRGRAALLGLDVGLSLGVVLGPGDPAVLLPDGG